MPTSDELIHLIQMEKCKNRTPCSVRSKCVCANQAKRIEEKAHELATVDCSFASKSRRGQCISIYNETCLCFSEARKQLKL